jgi:hypothetical protein
MAVRNSEPKSYTVTAEVQFTCTATSIRGAYKEFEHWMAKTFNGSFDADGKALSCVPSYYEGLIVAKDFNG